MAGSARVFVNALKAHQIVYEQSRGLVGHRLLGMPALLLRTTGRKSGLRPAPTPSSTAVTARRWLVCASNGGHHKPPAWLLNLEANPQVEVHVGWRKYVATATALRPDDPDYERLFAICNRANRGQFAAYRKKTTRELPVIVLTPR